MPLAQSCILHARYGCESTLRISVTQLPADLLAIVI